MNEGEKERRREGAAKPVGRRRVIAKLSDAEGEAAETQSWIQFAVGCGYVSAAEGRPLYAEYDAIIGKLVNMIARPEDWGF